MKVSVIVPVYNQEAVIGGLLDSLSRLDYPLDELEVIMVDGGSRDRTADLVRRYPFKLFIEPGASSSYAARNLGIRESRGEILAFTDGDCVVSTAWLRELVDAFRNSAIGGAAGAIIPLRPKSLTERFQAYVGEPDHKPSHKPMPYAVTANVAFRREAFRAIGLFDDAVPSGSDIDFSLRLQKSGKYGLVFLRNKAVVYHRNISNFKTLLTAVEMKGYGYYHLSKKHPDVFPHEQTASAGPMVAVPPGAWQRTMRIGRRVIGFALRGNLWPIVFEPFRLLWHMAWIRGFKKAELEFGSKRP